MNRKEQIKRFKLLLTALGLGLSMNGCYYGVEGEEQYIEIIGKNSPAFDPIINTKEYNEYLKVRNIKKTDCTLLESNDEYITIEYKTNEHTIEDMETITSICRRYEMTIQEFKSLNPEYEEYDITKKLPENYKVKINFDKIYKIKKQHIMYSWEECIVGPGDNLYKFCDADWNLIEITRENNDLDKEYTVYLYDRIYVPQKASVYGGIEETTIVTEAPTEMKIYR